MTAVEAERLIQNLKSDVAAGREPIEKLIAARTSVIDEVPRWVVQGQRRDTMLLAKIAKIEAQLGGAAPGPEPVTGEVVDAPPPPVNGHSGPRVSADGQPMSPEQAALEDMMDAAPVMAPEEAAATPVNQPAPPKKTKSQSAGR